MFTQNMDPRESSKFEEIFSGVGGGGVTFLKFKASSFSSLEIALKILGFNLS